MRTLVAFVAVFALAAAALAATIDIDVTGMQSKCPEGFPNNDWLHADLGPDAIVTGIGWDNVTLQTRSPSWLSDASMGFEGQFYLKVGDGDNFSGTRTYSSGGIIVFADLVPPLPDITVDGLLDIEFFETFIDYPGEWEATYLSGTFTVEYISGDASPCDFDQDGDVDLDDYEVFYDCMAGPDETPVPSGTTADDCLQAFDFDDDDDVDAQDFTSFMGVFTGTPPTIITHPLSQQVPEGGTATFFVEVDGSEPFSYQWKKGSTDLDGETEFELIIENVTYEPPSDGGWYRCTVTNMAGEVTSNAGLLYQ